MLGWLKSLFAAKPTILVSIPVADAFPNDEEMAARNRITDDLDAIGFGKFVGAGGGFNQMDFQYDVVDAEVAKKQVAETMEKHHWGRTHLHVATGTLRTRSQLDRECRIPSLASR